MWTQLPKKVPRDCSSTTRPTTKSPTATSTSNKNHEIKCYIEEKIADLAPNLEIKCYIEKKIVDIALDYKKDFISLHTNFKYSLKAILT